MSTLIAWSLVAILAAALARGLMLYGRKTAEIKRLKDEVETLKIQINIASQHVDATTAYDGLRSDK